MATISDPIRRALHTSPRIEPAAEVARRVQFLVDYCLTSAAHGFVLGISGGQDSSLAGRLCQLAAEELRRRGADARFTAVRLPYRVQADEADAQLALGFIGADEVLDVDIAAGADGVAAAYEAAAGEPLSDFVKGNVKARVRMTAQYAIAGQRGQLVVGTDHAAEAVTGFFTKYGDGGADVVPLTGLSKRQGAALLSHLGAPARLWEKAPTADLLDEAPGQTDESSLGLTYAQIDDYLEGREVAEDTARRIEERYRATEHKRRVPVGPDDEWWIRC
ncbi:ammonia-dependent NAD(+) synthetase [Brevibacterium sp. 5221]|uniref:NH(3)-dependent NAD(+) synthetase n=1 Tax=Brevibacterium rongguiense TaxID=2695267 RepID=A0A6N9H904_9MICO|nr:MULTISPECIES: ammonia-dependent NAD(+) synthetase [Brevibacterium]MYM20517.1 ammonia-dependent NAD(+) synthetase [Brevibacterium rongguiense]WAL40999.1 ammonia-dependent NAD(+) synthetase [Brevibacterium sp. BRM-1]